MDNKRLALAVVISCAVFLGWNFLSVKMGWVPDPALQVASVNATAPAATENRPAAAAPAPGDPSAAAGLAAAHIPAFIPTEGRLVTVETPLYKAVFHSNGGILREFSLKQYRQSLTPDSPNVNLISQMAAGQAPMGLLLDGIPSWTGQDWSLEGDNLTLTNGKTGVLRFSADIAGMRVIRELVFSGDSYSVNEKVRVKSAEARSFNLAFTFAASSLSSEKSVSMLARARYAIFGGKEPVEEESQYNPTRVAWLHENKFSEDSSQSDLTEGKLVQGKVSWMSVMNNYFMGCVSMTGDDASAKAKLINGVFTVLVGKTGLTVSKDHDAELDSSYYLGPKETKRLDAAANSMGKALDYGFFSIVAKPLVWLLQFFNGYVNNYGVAIILMTLVIKIVFWPLSQKSYKSMNQMKKLQPMMAKIREKHAGDKEALNREIMQLYKTYKVNPAGGCLPILVQIPVFFGLYQALLNAIELRHAPFITHLPFTDHLWLADLSAHDPYCITPLVMGATMFLQQKMTPAPGDPTQAKVMMFMPLIFTVLFINFPAGLVVYWLVNNVISITQQWLQLRRC